MPYLIKFQNNRTGKTVTQTTEGYTAAYRILSDYAFQVGYKITSVHGEQFVVSGSPQEEFYIALEKISYVEFDKIQNK